MDKKNYIIIAFILVIGILSFFLHKRNEEIALLTEKNTNLNEKILKDGTVRSSGSIVSKEELNNLIKQSGINSGELKKDLDSLDAEIKGIQILITKSNRQTHSNVSSTSTSNGDINAKPPEIECNGRAISCPDEFGYFSKVQNLKLNESFSNIEVPFGEVSFKAWEKNPWNYKTSERQYVVSTVISEDDNGKNIIHNKMYINTDGNKYEIPISSNYSEEIRSNSFRFNPRIYLGIDSGIIIPLGPSVPNFVDINPNISVFLFSYGKTKLDNDWIFLGLGGGYEIINQNANFLITPLAFNIGKPIPLIENLYLGPSLSLDFKSNFGVFFGLKVGL